VPAVGTVFLSPTGISWAEDGLVQPGLFVGRHDEFLWHACSVRAVV